jgi:DNA repair exonuclease SbcCD ATPase subunit
MILLRHLHITAFKHLRDIDLWLPRRGSVLIEGHNESGKSTLFEAIYFALYGRALVGEHQGQPSLDALIPHGGSRVGVQLTIQVGATELEIKRTLTRGANNANKVTPTAELRIIRPGRPIETLSTITAVNDCILNEMNGLDSAVLRNSCLMEQQALDRIETLSRESRELAIAKLLGIETIQRIEGDLRVRKQDEARLDQARLRLDVARQREAAQQAREAAQEAARSLRAARARVALLARDALAGQLQTAQSELDTVAEELSRMGDRSERAALLDAFRARGEQSARLLHEAEQQENALAMLLARQGHAASAEENAATRSGQLAQVAEDIASAEAREREQRERVAVTSRRGRSNGWLAGAVALAALLLGVAGALAQFVVLLPLALVTLVAALALLIRWRRLRASARDGQGKLAALERETLQARATHDAMRRISVSAAGQQGVAPAELAAQEERAFAARNAVASELQAYAAALAQADIAVPDVRLTSLAEMRRAHEALGQLLQREMERLDVGETQRQQGSLSEREQQLRARCAELAVQRDDQRQRLTALLAEEGIATLGDETMVGLTVRWPALAGASAAGDPDALAEELTRASAIEQQLTQQVAERCQRHGFDAATLDAATCQTAYVELEQGMRQRRLAAQMADEVFRRIVQRVLPETEMHMRALLPELTDGRYRDVRLLSDDENSADLRIQLWDEQAGRFVGKNLFSGGARDQCSLALRLAFALATLPQELGAMPGFIFLDEPLSSSDDRRAQALVDVLTRGPIARQFPQVFLISHSQSFDPAAFTCALRMSAGRVASSTLPDEETARAQWQQD